MEKKEIIQISATTTVIIILLILLFSNKSSLSFRQIGDYINQGNEFFDEKKYDDAKIKYVGALQIDSTNSGALYNNANADYRNGRYEMADKTYANAVRSTLKSDASEDSKELVSSIYKNKGNANMKRLTPLDSILMTNDLITKMEAAGQNVNEIKQQFYNNLQENLKIIQTPIKDYKESLRNAPENDSTRFNLAMAQDYEKKVAQILQSMTPPSNGQNNQNNNQKDQNQDQQQQQQDEQQSKDQMSKENAEQILNALEQEEKDQQKKRKIEQKDSRYKTDKDW
ncbi:MAG: hypothetical protein J6Y78_12310 [Paludibacteraceae bacterium]|nr:hypothetical protein [Paludibacteraceae bacterium]